MKPFDFLKPSLILRLEGSVILIGAICLYVIGGGNWWLFVLLFFAPDISWLGYLANTGIGAIIYNLFHNYVLPLLLLGAGYLFKDALLSQLALIWVAHIGIDRLMGYGLKYATAFKDTHLQRV